MRLHDEAPLHCTLIVTDSPYQVDKITLKERTPTSRRLEAVVEESVPHGRRLAGMAHPGHTNKPAARMNRDR